MRRTAPPQKVVKTDAEWRAQLSPEQYHITREHGTERACSGPFWREKVEGVFRCICCDEPLFSSDTKFDSGTGWPSFFQPIDEFAVTELTDTSYGMRRIEIRCATCDAHLGHVFPDGPKPTGLRYCMNGFAMRLDPNGLPD